MTDGFAYPTSQQRPVSHPELRPRNLPAQDRELVPQHQQLKAFHVQAAAAPHERAEKSPNGEVEEGEGHAADPPNPSRPHAATPILAPFTCKASGARSSGSSVASARQLPPKPIFRHP